MEVDVKEDSSVDLPQGYTREAILDFEYTLKKHPDVILGDSDLCPLKHSFCEGIYVREIFIPAGMVLTGKIHKHEHPNFLMSGEVYVVTESGGSEHLVGPVSIISKAGTKRVVHAVQPTIWVTVHSNPTNTRDLKELEEMIIAKDYIDFDNFIQSSRKSKFRILKYIKNLIGK